ETVSGHQRPAAFLSREFLGDAHHQPAVQDNPKGRRRAKDHLALDLAKRYEVQPGIKLVAGEQFNEFAHLLLRGAAYIGASVKMHEDRSTSSFHHSVSGDG